MCLYTQAVASNFNKGAWQARVMQLLGLLTARDPLYQFILMSPIRLWLSVCFMSFCVRSRVRVCVCRRIAMTRAFSCPYGC